VSECVCVCYFFICIYVYICLCLYIYMCVSPCVPVCVCVFVRMHHMYTHSNKRTHKHTHTHAAEMNYSPPRDKNEFSSQSSLSAAATREALTSGGEDRGRCGAKFRGDAHQIYIHAYIYLHIYVGRMAWLELSTALGV
jgi:hypothetical protein